MYESCLLFYWQLFLPRVMMMYLIAGSAFLFYVTKIPERYFPGESLFVFNSVSCWELKPEGGKYSENTHFLSGDFN